MLELRSPRGFLSSEEGLMGLCGVGQGMPGGCLSCVWRMTNFQSGREVLQDEGPGRAEV